MAYNHEKQFRKALDLAIAENPIMFRKAAEQLLFQAAEGKPWAIRELADRQATVRVEQQRD